MAYRRASLIDLYIRTKFHWNRKKLFVDGRTNSAGLRVWSIETYSPNFVNFGEGSHDTMHQSLTDTLLKWFLDNFPMFADSFSVLSIHCCPCPAMRGGSLRQHGVLVSFLAIRTFRLLLLMVLNQLDVNLKLDHTTSLMSLYVAAFSKGWLHRKLGDLVCLECREENRPFSGQQHQAWFGLNPTLHMDTYLLTNGHFPL